MKQRAHVYYSGRVQGIGFRFTVRQIAEDSGITGWVKNLKDGRVEVVVEAEEGTIKKFLGSVIAHFSKYIQDADVQWGPATGEFKEFAIAF
ncbi:MAG: acylphosphatase [Candidatus Omnitrophota bacterium]|jgi:acylphosphatase|nr:MAG: acylphosphatase [Candidatus Omnitrophota bacterium]